MAKRPFNVTFESYGISQEYNTIDLPRFFLGSFNTLYRAFTNKSKTKIRRPGVLISLFLGKWTDVGTILGTSAADADVSTIDAHLDNAGLLSTSAHDFVLGKKDINIYKLLFVEFKKVNVRDQKQYESIFEEFKKAIAIVKQDTCNILSSYRAVSTSELADLKLFKPEKIDEEVSRAMAYYNQRDPKFAKFAASVADWIGKNIVNYILDNTIID